MNRQTKAVSIAAVVGLALGLWIQASSVMTAAYVTPLDRFNPFNPSVLGYWVGALSIFPMILVVITTAVTARKAGWRNSILNSIGAIVGVWATICVAIIVLAAAQPKKEFPLADASADRASFVEKASVACVPHQQSLPENTNASAAAIEAYCTCYGNSLADVTTMDELQYMRQHRTPSPSLAAKIFATYPKCSQALNNSRQ